MRLIPWRVVWIPDDRRRARKGMGGEIGVLLTSTLKGRATPHDDKVCLIIGAPTG